RPEGLKQSFVVEAPPEGGGPLVLEGRVEGAGLSGQTGGALYFGEGSSRTVSYAGLKAIDATARPLEATLSWQGRIRITVERSAPRELGLRRHLRRHLRHRGRRAVVRPRWQDRRRQGVRLSRLGDRPLLGAELAIVRSEPGERGIRQLGLGRGRRQRRRLL